MPRWRNLLALKESLRPTLSATTTNATQFASFHYTPVPCDKWKSKWNFVQDDKKAQQPAKNYVRYAVRHKRADARRALKDLLFNHGSPKVSFTDDDPRGNFDGRNGQDPDNSGKRGKSKFSARRAGKFTHKKINRKHRRESFSEDSDHPSKEFQATFGDRWYTWSFTAGTASQGSTSGFEWRESSNWKNGRAKKKWDSTSETESESESEDEACNVGSRSERTTLGLPPTGPIKIGDVKKAFRLSALKWHPDKHQGPSQVMAEEKFKLCVNAYKSLCDALA